MSLRSLRSRLFGQEPPPPPKRIHYSDGGEDRVVYELPTTRAADRNSVLAFSMPKAGSVLLNRILMELSEAVGLSYVSIMDVFFGLGIPDDAEPASTSDIFVAKGYCYGGFRRLPRAFPIPIVDQVKTILLVRDPRDMLVSHYYSMRESHPSRGKALKTSVPEIGSRDLAQHADVDSYVREIAPYYRELMDDYRQLFAKTPVRLFRYEEVIFQKGPWIDELCAYYEWDVSPSKRRQIASKNNLQPAQDQPKEHVRQVRPGDHTRKLTPETAAYLTDYFRDQMDFFGYSNIQPSSANRS